MQIEYRKATAEDTEAVAKMRIDQLRSEGGDTSADLMPQLIDYYTRHFADGTFRAWLCESDGVVIGGCGASFVEKPPYFENPTGRLALISGMYVDPSFRKRGIAKTLLQKVVAEAEQYGCKSVQVTSSRMGVPLYRSVGFEDYDRYLQYIIK